MTEVEIEQVPRGSVTLIGRRDLQPMEWTVGAGYWTVRVAPDLAGHLRELYREGTELRDAKREDEAFRRWRQAATEAEAGGDHVVASWFLANTGRIVAQAQRWADADPLYSEALRALQESDRPVRQAILARDWCRAVYAQSRETLGACSDRALALAERHAPGTLVAANALANVGTAHYTSGDLDKAERYHRRSLEIRQGEAPGSLVVALTFNALGGVAVKRGDLEVAQQHFSQGLALVEALDPSSPDVARYLNNLGEVARQRGELDAAQEYFARALAVFRRVEPGHISVGVALANVGLVAQMRGHLATAWEYLREALALWEKFEPAGINTIQILNDLGVTALARSDLDSAESLLRRALRSIEALAPESAHVPETLNHLGLVVLERGDFKGAEELWTRALALRQKLAPGSLAVADTLENLGRAAQARGDLGAAEARYREALEAKNLKAPESLEVAESRYLLGDLARIRKDPATAETELRMALAIQQHFAPGSTAVARSLHSLGLIERETGKLQAATGSLCQAAEALETQHSHLGGDDEVRSSFGVRYSDYEHACMAALVEQGRPAEAYHVLERSRARSLLRLLAERDLSFSATLPAEAARDRKVTNAEYDRVQASIATLTGPQDSAKIEPLLLRLKELRDRQQQIAARIRQSAPQFASLQYPVPLDVAAARDALDPGTALLAYAVGKESTLLFVLQPTGASERGLGVFSLPVGAVALRAQVEAFRSAILPHARTPPKVLAALGADLFDLLIRPAAGEIAAAERLLISPDGPLHSLPFPALVRRSRGKTATSYLVEWKALHLVPSATVYAEIKKSRRDAAQPGRLVAFGDPRYPATTKESARGAGDAEVRSAVDRGFDFAPLPMSRDEVESITRLFPGASQQYLGAEATEEHAKALGPDVRHLHFACHGTLDERFPLNSALALTIPENPAEGQDNGLLQAWEIFDRVRLDADLVTLSACNSGLGKEMGGEGLVGLTRAFLYAGARSVVASLWAVSDRSTPVLMTSFYRHLKAGSSRDEALRAAQIEMIRGRASGTHRRWHPFHWAAFQLAGDWR